ncbi:MAG TPA: glycerol-3-phosphate 1-O-acyltransferase PlsY, partial [bacterium]|nr:glycerol-3-phosphate 1-O-acyltransferase PlsY [bacterium]
IVSRLFKGIDIRDHGSGNAGATNVYRIVGWQAALIVVIVDIGKGTLATVLISSLQIGALPDISHSILQIMAGVSAILGHSYPIFAGFRGGKGVATGAGMVMGLYPLIFLICLGVFILIVTSTGTVSLASMLAAITLPVVVFFLNGISDLPLFIFSIIIPLFIIYTHRENVSRLIRGEEKVLHSLKVFGKKPKDK